MIQVCLAGNTKKNGPDPFLLEKYSQPYGLLTLHLGRSKRALIDEKCGDPAMKPRLRRPVTGDERGGRRLRS